GAGGVRRRPRHFVRGPQAAARPSPRPACREARNGGNQGGARMNPDDLHSLSQLPGEQPSAELDRRVRRAAHAELSLAMGPRWRVIGTLAWTRVALPAGVAVTV